MGTLYIFSFILVFCLIALSRASSVMLNRNVESGRMSQVPNRGGGGACSLSQFNVKAAVAALFCFVDILYQLEDVPSILSVQRVFIIDIGCILLDVFYFCIN